MMDFFLMVLACLIANSITLWFLADWLSKEPEMQKADSYLKKLAIFLDQNVPDQPTTNGRRE